MSGRLRENPALSRIEQNLMMRRNDDRLQSLIKLLEEARGGTK